MEKEVNNTVFKNFMITLLVVIIFNLLVKFQNKKNSVNKNVFLFYTVFSFFIWLITAPSIRMGLNISNISFSNFFVLQFKQKYVY